MENRIKKWWERAICAALAVMLAGTLAACGQEEPEVESEPVQEEAEESSQESSEVEDDPPVSPGDLIEDYDPPPVSPGDLIGDEDYDPLPASPGDLSAAYDPMVS